MKTQAIEGRGFIITLESWSSGMPAVALRPGDDLGWLDEATRRVAMKIELSGDVSLSATLTLSPEQARDLSLALRIAAAKG